MSNDKGYTLVELLAVIAIMAVTALVVVPKGTAFLSSQKVETVAAEIASDIRLTQQKAITEGRYWEICFYDTFYKISQGASNVYKTVRLPTGVSWHDPYNPSGSRLQFGANGVPANPTPLSNPYTVGISDNRNNVRYIITTPVIGRVRISRTPPP